MNTFIKDERQLDETHEITDLLDFSAISSKFSKILNNADKSVLIGLVGAFGTGKSTMLYNLSQSKKTKQNGSFSMLGSFQKEVTFGEGFVLDFVRILDKSLFEKTRKRIDGVSHNPIKLLIKVLAQGVNFFIPGSDIIANFSSLFHSSPARRVFEFQEILEQFINKNTGDLKTIYIVIEDIDRSGDSGIYFLETLRQFLKTTKLDKKLVVIVPISDKNYIDKKESYLKSLDYTHIFEPKQIDFTNFIKTVFQDSIINKDELIITHLSMFLKSLLQHFKLTFREIKNLLRNANIAYKSLDDEEIQKIDIRIFMLFSVMIQSGFDFISDVNGTCQFTAYSMVPYDSSWITPYLMLIANNKDEIGTYRTDIPIVFKGNTDIIPKFTQSVIMRGNDSDGIYRLSEIYLYIFGLK